jgi:hypothetical protein
MNGLAMSLFDALQASALAHAIAESRWATAILSAVHLIGFTVVMGSALVTNLRLVGALFPERPATDVMRPATRALAVGLAISAATGALLFAPRAAHAAVNSIFQVKMLLLASAVTWHATVQPRVASRMPEPVAAVRVLGATGLALWVSLALAGCAFILFE